MSMFHDGWTFNMKYDITSGMKFNFLKGDPEHKGQRIMQNFQFGFTKNTTFLI